MIILPWGTYCYKLSQMAIANSPENFEQRRNDLFNEFEFICAHIDNILILTTGYWIYHVHTLELTLKKRNEK